MTGPGREEGALPVGYGELLEQVKAAVWTARVDAARAVNVELLACTGGWAG